MNPKIQSFYGDNEKDILEKTAKVLDNSDRSGFHLSGYNIEKFDVPYLWKRMLSHGITPPKIISAWDKKPWELKFFDLAKFWSGGAWNSFTSMDTVGALMDIGSSKGNMKGSDVHDAYWNEHRMEEIKTYCEEDVRVTMSMAERFLGVLSQVESNI